MRGKDNKYFIMGTGIGKTYLKFFVDNINSRWTLLCGGRRSGKSFAVYKWLHILASGQPKTVGVVAASFPALQSAISDFQRATGLLVAGNSIYGYSARLSNGSLFQFKSYDDPTKCQGSTFDILYLEEGLNIPEEIVSTLSMSVTGQIFTAFNPTKSGWINKYIAKDKSNFLVTTFKDNPWLTKEQIGEFEDIKERAMKPTASILDTYNYKVYYCGEFADMAGKVFRMVYSVTDEDYEKVPASELWGLDFGWVSGDQCDATALIGCKIHEGKAYFRQYIYSSHLANNKDLALRMAECGLDVYSPVVADYGGLGASRIRALVTAEDCSWTEPSISSGFSVQNARKGKVIDGLNRMLQYDIYVTDTSYELRSEFDNYELNREGKPVSGALDHGIDACRYALCGYGLNFDL